MTDFPASRDEAIQKGATEQDGPQDAAARPSSPFQGQLGHRDQDEMLKENDSDFPEPGAREEHTGE